MGDDDDAGSQSLRHLEEELVAGFAGRGLDAPPLRLERRRLPLLEAASELRRELEDEVPVRARLVASEPVIEVRGREPDSERAGRRGEPDEESRRVGAARGADDDGGVGVSPALGDAGGTPARPEELPHARAERALEAVELETFLDQGDAHSEGSDSKGCAARCHLSSGESALSVRSRPFRRVSAMKGSRA